MGDLLGVGILSRTGVETVRTCPPLKCASLLKPLYCWVAGEVGTDAQSSIITSDNTTTDRVVDRCGGVSATVRKLSQSTGVALEVGATWGSVLVTPQQVLSMYESLLASSTGESFLSLMRSVESAQRLGCAALWAEATGQEGGQVAVKAGWDLGDDGLLRTHVVLLGEEVGCTVLTGVELSLPQCLQWREELASRGPEAVLPLHMLWAGDLLHSGVLEAVERLG